jgi:lipopolysaccharide/colanic/teichoic acid biosynthesis glycosyltransferase
MLTRSLDITISLIGCCFLFLMYPFIALMIKISSRGPVFYKCDRVGKDGNVFKMYKFRTMYETVGSLGASVSAKGDARVTPIGALLRRSKLNELPQFINILKGEMTLVGPRPEAPDLAADYPTEAKVIFSIKPGLVGPNQIFGRNEEDLYPPGIDTREYYIKEILPQKLALDLKYIAEKSFLNDLKYLFLGFWVTITRALNRQHLIDNFGKICILFADCIFCLFSFTFAHLIRLDGFTVTAYSLTFLKILPFTIVARIPLLIYAGCYQPLIRLMSLHDLKKVFQVVTLGSGVLAIFFYFSRFIDSGYPRSVFIIDWLCLSILLIGYRIILMKPSHAKQDSKNGIRRHRALIWGAREEGLWCLRCLLESRDPRYEVVGFIDDNFKMRNRRINGSKVLGDFSQLEIIASLYKVQEIFLTENIVDLHKLHQIHNVCSQRSIALKCFIPRKIMELTPILKPEILSW